VRVDAPREARRDARERDVAAPTGAASRGRGLPGSIFASRSNSVPLRRENTAHATASPNAVSKARTR